jgi:hypothetical protein
MFVLLTSSSVHAAAPDPTNGQLKTINSCAERLNRLFEVLWGNNSMYPSFDWLNKEEMIRHNLYSGPRPTIQHELTAIFPFTPQVNCRKLDDFETYVIGIPNERSITLIINTIDQKPADEEAVVKMDHPVAVECPSVSTGDHQFICKLPGKPQAIAIRAPTPDYSMFGTPVAVVRDANVVEAKPVNAKSLFAQFESHFKTDLSLLDLWLKARAETGKNQPFVHARSKYHDSTGMSDERLNQLTQETRKFVLEALTTAECESTEFSEAFRARLAKTSEVVKTFKANIEKP